MKQTRHQIIPAILMAQVLILASDRLIAQEVFARWSFDELTNSTTLEEVSHQPDRIVGFYDPVAGVSQGAIQFDGYTSYLERTNFSRELPAQFTINAWLALESYHGFGGRSLIFGGREKTGSSSASTTRAN